MLVHVFLLDFLGAPNPDAVHADHADDLDVAGLADAETTGSGLVLRSRRPIRAGEVDAIATLYVEPLGPGLHLDKEHLLLNQETHDVAGDAIVETEALHDVPDCVLVSGVADI